LSIGELKSQMTKLRLFVDYAGGADTVATHVELAAIDGNTHRARSSASWIVSSGFDVHVVGTLFAIVIVWLPTKAVASCCCRRFSN
jgi:hypothetical protein